MRLLQLVSLLALFPLSSHAAELRSAGIWGNSGEQGSTLVRFGEKPATGMGVVYDRSGSLWDRGGVGVLNRYAPDGRQLATYRIAPGTGGRGGADRIVLFDETLMLKLDRKLFTLSVNDTPDIEPSPMEVEATRLSPNVENGWAAATKDAEVFLVNLSGETQAVTELEGIQNIALGPDAGVYVVANGKMQRVDAAAPADNRGPWTSPGDCPQWLNGYWFGFTWHGTIRRFSASFNPDPGVVLGGASGSFIGYVEGNHELDNGRGLAHLGGDLYAISGMNGIVHLLEWNAEDKRFKIIRRIGAISDCHGLALDAKGRVWYYSGTWNWNDGPAAPLHDSVPGADGYGIFGATIIGDGVMVAPAIRWGKTAVYAGKLSEPVRAYVEVKGLPTDGSISTVVEWDKKRAVFVANKSGKGAAIFIDTNGKPGAVAGDMELVPVTPINEWTSLTSVDDDTLIGAGDGQVVEFQRAANRWTETRRWNSWGTQPDQNFGPSIFLAVHQKRLWVADSGRQRVVCFDLATGQPVATFGSLDQAGDNLTTLNAPQVIAANGERAVVFDSGNQRLMKLELAP